MIWSIIPEEFIFAGEEAAAGPSQQQYLGRQVLVSGGRIVSLLSTDPSDFLDARFSPGSQLVDQQA